MKKTVLALAAAAFATLGAASAFADDHRGHGRGDDRPCGNVPVQNWMSEAQLRERLAPLNLQIEEIDIDDGCYEVEVRNADNRKLDILFHPETGEQVRIDG
jgi:hypothetical protein